MGYCRGRAGVSVPVSSAAWRPREQRTCDSRGVRGGPRTAQPSRPRPRATAPGSQWERPRLPARRPPARGSALTPVTEETEAGRSRSHAGRAGLHFPQAMGIDKVTHGAGAAAGLLARGGSSGARARLTTLNVFP